MKLLVLTDDEFDKLLYCVTEIIDRRHIQGIHVPEWMIRLARKIDLTSAMSPRGQFVDEIDCADEQLTSMNVVGSREAAGMLGVTPRQVRRILDGRMVSGRLVYDIADIAKCIEHRGATA